MLFIGKPDHRDFGAETIYVCRNTSVLREAIGPMMVIVGGILVLVAVVVGFSMAGGELHSLIHPSEFVTIGGSALGALLIMSPKKVLVDLLRGVVQVFKGSPYKKETCIELLQLLNSLSLLVRRDGLLALDSHVSDPKGSDLLQRYPKIYNNHHVRNFLCDGLALIVDGKADAGQLMEALEEEIQVVEREHHAAVGAMAKTADALPGFGIVAAVLGIVVTMGAIDGPVEEIGHKVGAALVGTFLGILMSYGFLSPMAARLESLGEQEAVFLRAIAGAVVEMSQSSASRDVVNRARRVLGTDVRPTQGEMTQIFSESGSSRSGKRGAA
jgi:chemotaxis protein MotA